MPAKSNVTTDHETIRRWVEERGGSPACVRGTGGKGDIGMLRIDFPGYSGEQSLEHIGWDEWLRKFDERNLAFLHQDQMADGTRSNFNKLIGRETAAARAHGQRRASRRRLRASSGRKAASRRRSRSGSRSRSARTTARSSRGKTRASSRGSAKRSSTGRSSGTKSSGGRSKRSARSSRRASAPKRGRRIRAVVIEVEPSPRSRSRRSGSNRGKRAA
jgi:hypothetical protein